MQRHIQKSVFLSSEFQVDSPLPGPVMINNYSFCWERQSPNLDRIFFFLLERGEGGEKDKERNMDAREKC